jgi:predicted metal-dependent phosphoesterase TrpH
MRNPDLHSHSHCSDGLLSPAAVAQLARDGGVDAWALTDHDTVAGVPEARAAAEALGLRFIAGVEVSVTWKTTTLHIVGLGIEESHAGLNAVLARNLSRRQSRAQAIAESLEKAGIKNAYEGALSFASSEEQMGRTHFARHIVNIGKAKTVGRVFKRFLSRGKPGYVPEDWVAPEVAVAAIREAGGVAVLAHPGRYSIGSHAMLSLIDEFKGWGGEGIEVSTANHTTAQILHFAHVATKHGLKASRGSDYHGPRESYARPGAIPPLPSGCEPVWAGWS